MPGDLLCRRALVPHPQPPRLMQNGGVEREGAGVMENPCSSQGQCLQTQSGLQPGLLEGSAPLGHPQPQASFVQGPHRSRAEVFQAGVLGGVCAAVWAIGWLNMPILQRSKLSPRGKQRTRATQVSDRVRTRISYPILLASPNAAEGAALFIPPGQGTVNAKLNSALQLKGSLQLGYIKVW